jgi:hypothetical protein
MRRHTQTQPDDGSRWIWTLKGKLVDLIGIEPMTSSMPWKRAPSCATGPLFEDLTIVARRSALRQTSVEARRNKRR